MKTILLFSLVLLVSNSISNAQDLTVTDVSKSIVHPAGDQNSLQVLCKWDSPAPVDTTAWRYVRLTLDFEKTAKIDKGLGILLHKITTSEGDRWMEREDQTSIGGDASGFRADSTGDYSLIFDLTDIVNSWVTEETNNGIVLTSAEPLRPLSKGFIKIKSKSVPIRIEYYY